MDGDEAAAWFAAQGAHARSHLGHWWVRRPKHLGGAAGYWAPVGLIDALPADRISSPSGRAIGYRAVVAEPSAATGMTAWNIIDALPEYGARRLQRDRARRVRNALARLEFQLLADDPEPLLRGGFAAARATAQRSGKPIPDSERTFRREVLDRYAADPQLIVGAFADGQLVAYALSHAVGRTAHFTDVVALDAGRRLGASDGLYWCTLRTWATTPGITRANLGMRLAERPGIEPYKDTFGSRVVPLPVVGDMRWPLGPMLRRWRPATAQRLGIADAG